MKQAVYRSAVLLAAGVLIAACGSSSSSRSAATAAATPTTSSTGTTTSAAPAKGPATKLSTKHSKLGTILAAGPKNLTVYLFEADKGTTSKCSGPCAKAWPPVTTSGTPTISGGVQASLVGTTTRSDGTKQVTYKGHPLYYFIKDKDDGDTYGEGSKQFGAGWYVLQPNGKKIDTT